MNRETVPCELCGEQTPMTGTRRCDRCWELERRIHANPDLARSILGIAPIEAVVAAARKDLAENGTAINWMRNTSKALEAVPKGDTQS